LRRNSPTVQKILPGVQIVDMQVLTPGNLACNPV
jgi:hypothetical protein